MIIPLSKGKELISTSAHQIDCLTGRLTDSLTRLEFIEGYSYELTLCSYDFH
ncbi:hypothetical protein ES708_28263 [subsurface metagenome]